MRLKAQIWIKAYVRRCQSEGCPAVIARHGDDDAGAIFIRVCRLDGTSLVFGPAAAGLDGADTDRQFMPSLDARAVPDAEADAYLQRQAEFDSDVWIVEIESRGGRHFLEDWLAPLQSRPSR